MLHQVQTKATRRDTGRLHPSFQPVHGKDYATRGDRIQDAFYRHGTREERNAMVLRDAMNYGVEESRWESYEKRFQMAFDGGLLPSLENVADGKHDPMRLLKWHTIARQYIRGEIFGVPALYPDEWDDTEVVFIGE